MNSPTQVLPTIRPDRQNPRADHLQENDASNHVRRAGCTALSGLGARGGLLTQGGAARINSRFALPWADMLRPCRAIARYVALRCVFPHPDTLSDVSHRRARVGMIG